MVAFGCHEKFKESDFIYGKPLISIEKGLKHFPQDIYEVFIAVGYRKMNKIREQIYNEIKEMGYKCATFIYPSVKIWSSNKIGDNVFIFENNTIQPFVEIGSDTILWSGNHIGHHSKIGNHCFISSHVVISGSCIIGNNVFIGVNATLRDGLRIADETLIGAGCLIMKDTNPREVYINKGNKPIDVTSDKINF